jgi:hypothetical protein
MYIRFHPKREKNPGKKIHRGYSSPPTPPTTFANILCDSSFPKKTSKFRTTASKKTMACHLGQIKSDYTSVKT